MVLRSSVAPRLVRCFRIAQEPTVKAIPFDSPPQLLFEVKAKIAVLLLGGLKTKTKLVPAATISEAGISASN
jgi:hypothetical protein